MPTLLPFSLTLIIGPTWCTKYATSRRSTWNAKSRPSSSNEPGTHASHEPGTRTSYEPGANAPYEPAKDEPRTGSPDESRPNGSTASSTDAGTRHVVIHDLANNASSLIMPPHTMFSFVCQGPPPAPSMRGPPPGGMPVSSPLALMIFFAFHIPCYFSSFFSPLQGRPMPPPPMPNQGFNPPPAPPSSGGQQYPSGPPSGPPPMQMNRVSQIVQHHAIE